MTAHLQIPDHLPLVEQDITIMRCLICGAIVPGTWGITRQSAAPGVDHLLDRHRAEVVAYTVPLPAFANCAIQDPFWFDEHTGGDQ